MTPADAEAVARIAAQVPGEGWSAASFRQDLETNGAARYIVLADGEAGPIVGYAGLWLIVGEAHVINMGIDRAFRRRGLGRLVLLALVHVALATSVDVLTLEVRMSNGPARALYGEFGFSAAGERKAYYRDNGEDALIMSTESIGSAAYRARLSAIEQRVEQRWPGTIAAFERLSVWAAPQES